MSAEMQGIVLFGSTDRMRRQAADMAVTQLIEESCFLSPERQRHDACRAKALEILGFYDATDAAIQVAIPAHARFAMDFYCQGAALVCAACGALIGPGHRACPECGLAIEQPVGVLARPEWETRLTTKALEVAVATTLVADDLLMYTIHRTVRLFVLRNLLNQSSLDSWQTRVREIRETVLDAWPEGRKPDKESWQYRFIRVSAAFWVVAWPMLKDFLSLQQVDAFNTRLVRAIAASATRWADANADPLDYGQLVSRILSSESIDKVRAIQALSPADVTPVEGDEAPRAGKVVLHPPELLMRGTIAHTPLGAAWLAIPLHPPEVEALETRFGVAELPIAKLLAQFNEDAES